MSNEGSKALFEALMWTTYLSRVILPTGRGEHTRSMKRQLRRDSIIRLAAHRLVEPHDDV